MSWWLGLSREAFARALSTRAFSKAKVHNYATWTDYGRASGVLKGSLLREGRDRAGQNEVFFAGFSGGAVLTRPADDEVQDTKPVEVVQHNEELMRLDADRAYLEWYSQQNAPETLLRDFDVALQHAATLLMLLRHNVEPTTWERASFMAWCEEHSDALSAMLDLME